MDEIKKELSDALVMLGMIVLSGDAVDIMAAAKNKIRQSLTLLEKEDADGR